jgi:hypothetical protein
MLTGVGEYLETLQAKPTSSTDSINQRVCDGPELRKRMNRVKGIYIKMHHDLAMAKREIAWGKLSAKDIGSTNDLCRRILMPL